MVILTQTASLYTARDTEGLIAWIDSPELRAAIEARFLCATALQADL
jgi:hypothetical protein